MTDTDSDDDSSLPDSAPTVLLAGAPTDQLRADCTALHQADSNPHLLFITYTRAPSDYLAQIDEGAVDGVTVITVGDAAPEVDSESVASRHVAGPGDLTRLGIEIGSVLDDHEQVHVCFDSATTTLQYVGYPDLYEFLHAVVGRVRAADARAHVHINPIAHDDRVLAGLTTLFDARVDIEGDGRSVQLDRLLADTRNA